MISPGHFGTDIGAATRDELRPLLRIAEPRTRRDLGVIWARRLAAILLALHGIAHLVGTDAALSTARQQTTSPYFVDRITSVDYLFGYWSVSDQTTLLLLGAAWAVVAVAFLVASRWLWHLRPGWRIRLATAASASLVLCVAALPETWIGVPINVSVLAILLAAAVTAPRHVPGRQQ